MEYISALPVFLVLAALTAITILLIYYLIGPRQGEEK
jgi:hypothetical protein